MASGRANPTSHTYFSQQLRLHYLDWGNPEAPPLLLVHGSRDHCHNWDWVAQALRDDYHIIAPDLRGHGDSAWVQGSAYRLSEYVYDLAQLIHRQQLAPVTIIAHSLGGGVALRYAGIYPETIHKMVVIEGTGGPPALYDARPVAERLRDWIADTRAMAGRLPRRYPSLEAAYQRMHEENSHLRKDQARHLTIHGSNQNEDGSYSWKFDNYTRIIPPLDLSWQETTALWQNIKAPVLLVSGSESWVPAEVQEEALQHFPNARHETIKAASHWVHHDQLDAFLKITKGFLTD